jgi:hypothetical protein
LPRELARIASWPALRRRKNLSLIGAASVTSSPRCGSHGSYTPDAPLVGSRQGEKLAEVRRNPSQSQPLASVLVVKPKEAQRNQVVHSGTKFKEFDIAV